MLLCKLNFLLILWVNIIINYMLAIFLDFENGRAQGEYYRLQARSLQLRMFLHSSFLG